MLYIMGYHIAAARAAPAYAAGCRAGQGKNRAERGDWFGWTACRHACVRLLFFVYDLNQLHQNLRCLRWLFAAGCTLLAGATAWLLFSGRVLFSPPPFWSSLAWAVCAVFLFLLVYTLFFALPFGKTYIKGDSRRVCDTGVYALCRHPGFCRFAGAYLFAFWPAGAPACCAPLSCLPYIISAMSPYRTAVCFRACSTAIISTGTRRRLSFPIRRASAAACARCAAGRTVHAEEGSRIEF